MDWLTNQVSGHPITYLIALLASGGDVLFPPIPSETIVITAGVVVSRGDLSIWLLIPAAAVGAIIGDNISYWLGRRVGDPVADRLFRSDSNKARLAWAERAVRSHGSLLILVGRFIPGGRTVATFASGTLEMTWRRFLVADVIAATVWACYAALLGYFGGSAFQDSTWKPLAVALGVAALVAGLAEVWRRIQKRRGKDILGDPLTGDH